MAIYRGPNIVRSGLILSLDADSQRSYPGSGEIWYDLISTNNATRTINGGYGGQVTYNSDGYWDFTMNSPAITSGPTAGNGFTFNSAIVPTTNSFTISAWIRRNTSVKAFGDRETIMSNAGSGDGYRFGVNSDGSIYYLIGGVGDVGYQEGSLGGSTLVNGNWHMMTGVFDRAAVSGSYKVYGYIDGSASGSVTISAGAGGNVAFTTNNTGIGYYGCCDVWAGHVAILSAYSKYLSPTEVLQNFNAQKGRFGL